jgi:uncharacterized membrane protein YhaH (DUF805 family)
MADGDHGDAPEPRGRGRRAAHWGVVLTVLFVTFFAMLGAIYWAVQSGKL